MPPASSEQEPLYPEPALGYSTTTWPDAHPNLKPSLQLQWHKRRQEATTHGNGQPHQLQGNDSNSTAWGISILLSSVKLPYLPAKLLTGNNVISAGCCTCCFLRDKYHTQLNWKPSCFYSSQYNCTTAPASPSQQADVVTFYTMYFKTKKPGTMLCTSIKFTC